MKSNATTTVGELGTQLDRHLPVHGDEVVHYAVFPLMTREEFTDRVAAHGHSLMEFTGIESTAWVERQLRAYADHLKTTELEKLDDVTISQTSLREFVAILAARDSAEPVTVVDVPVRRRGVPVSRVVPLYVIG